MFQEKMAGGSNDPDDLIVRAFKAYEVDGKIEAEMFRHALMNFGDKFNKAEVDDIFGEFEVDDDGFIASKDVIGHFVAGGGEEKKEEAPPPAEEAPAEAPAEEAADDGAKKKKKKKKAAKSITNYTFVIFFYRSEFSFSCLPCYPQTDLYYTKPWNIGICYNDLTLSKRSFTL